MPSFQDLKKKVPSQVRRADPNLPASQYNAYQNLAALMDSLKSMGETVIGKDSAYPKAVQDNYKELMQHLTGLRFLLTGRDLNSLAKNKRPLTQEQLDAAKTAYENGTLKDLMTSVYFQLAQDVHGIDFNALNTEEEEKVQAKLLDNKKKEELTEKLSRCAAGLEYNDLFFVKKDHIQDAQAVSGKIIEAKEQKATAARQKTEDQQRFDGEIDFLNVGDHVTPATFIQQLRERIRRFGTTDISNDVKDSQYQLYAALFAIRRTADAARKDTTSLQKQINQNSFRRYYEQLRESETFKAFLDSHTPAELKAMATVRGHGGSMESQFRAFVKNDFNQRERIPDDIPQFYLPTALEQAERFKRLIVETAGNGDDTLTHTANLFASRICAEVSRNQKDQLKASTPTAREVADAAERLKESQTFRNFVRDKGTQIANLAAKGGHGGAIEDLYKKYVCNLERLPNDVSSRYMPTAKDRIEAVQKKIKSSSYNERSWEEKRHLYAEILAIRTAIGAHRDTVESLKRRFDYNDYKTAYNTISKNQTFKDYIYNNMGNQRFRRIAASGHGGEFEGNFKTYAVAQNDQTLPNRYRGNTGIINADGNDPVIHVDATVESEEARIKNALENADGLTLKDVKKLAAESMYVLQVRSNNEDVSNMQDKRINEMNDLAPAKMSNNVNSIMNDPAFKEMFKDLELDDAIELAKTGPTELTTRFAETKQELAKPKVQPKDEDLNKNLNIEGINNINEINIIKK